MDAYVKGFDRRAHASEYPRSAQAIVLALVGRVIELAREDGKALAASVEVLWWYVEELEGHNDPLSVRELFLEALGPRPRRTTLYHALGDVYELGWCEPSVLGASLSETGALELEALRASPEAPAFMNSGVVTQLVTRF